MSTINQKEYLKKYLSGPQKKKKKKNKNKASSDPRFQIVDTDLGSWQHIPIGHGSDDEAPTVAEVTYDTAQTKLKDEMEQMGDKWRPTLAQRIDGQTIGKNSATKNSTTFNNDKKRVLRHDSDEEDVIPTDEIKLSEHSSANKKRVRHDSDDSPLKKQRHGSDGSPPRRQRHDSDDSSPPRRQRHDSDGSPPRRQRHDSDGSPPRRRRHDSPPTRQRHDSDDCSPPRRQRHESDDGSPPRRRRQDFGKLISGKNSDRKSSNSINGSHFASYDGKENSSRSFLPKSKQISEGSKTNQQKGNCDSDESPPRKSRRKHDSDESPPRRNQQRYDSDESPPRRGKTSQDSDESPPRRAAPEPAKAADDRPEKKMTTQEYLRARKRGKLRKDTPEDIARKERESALQAAAEASHERWNRGEAQLRAQEQRVRDVQHEMGKSFARSVQDEDMNAMLKHRVREGDAMLDYISKKKTVGGPKMPAYQGPFPANRFNVRPGYRWDGVDRSSGFEEECFKKAASNIAIEEDAYKYCAEDM